MIHKLPSFKSRYPDISLHKEIEAVLEVNVLEYNIHDCSSVPIYPLNAKYVIFYHKNICRKAKPQMLQNWKVKRDGEAGRRGEHWEKVTFALD